MQQDNLHSVLNSSLRKDFYDAGVYNTERSSEALKHWLSVHVHVQLEDMIDHCELQMKQLPQIRCPVT